jgi:hypothetical protein
VASPPKGTLTFVFTDIEGSTKLWERDSSVMQVALARHDEILRSSIEERGGYVFKTVGDAFCAAFSTAPDALEAACQAGVKEDAERAARLWGAAQALHEMKGIPRDIDFLAEADARISAVRTGMGEEEWEETWRKGRAITLDEAVSYTLEEAEG